MTLTILRYPHPALATPCDPVEDFGPDLRNFADSLFDAMRKAPGVGITAAHVGHSMRLVVLDLAELDGRRDFVNPRILSASTATMSHEEGSVCMPGAIEIITRPSSIRLAYQDLDGTAHEIDLNGFPAICMQHEIDQLDGIFWLQRLSRLKRDRLIRKWEKDQRR